MLVRIFLISSLLLITQFGCSPKVRSEFVTGTEIGVYNETTSREEQPGKGLGCNDPLAYAPDLLHPGHVPRVAIRVAVHFMDEKTGLRNLNEEQGRFFAREMIAKCNAKLSTNVKMHLPRGNDTPVLPVPWYFVLSSDPDVPGDDGIYFHEDPELYYYIHGKNSNRTSREVVNRYSVNPDSVFNIFMMPHHPDSVKSLTYFPTGTGIMLGRSIKMAQQFSPELSPESCVGLLNHEMGHALGLSHAWTSNDGCDDTPQNPNCWYYTEEPPCDSLVSNNMMDYNAWQAALTPCQIGRVLRNVANLDSRVRKFVRPDWCTYDPVHTIIIRDTVHWSAPKDLAGDIILEDGGFLRLSCRVSLPEGGQIIVSPGSTLVMDGCRLHNACGEEWEGIVVRSKGKVSGTVQIARKPVIENVIHSVDLTAFQ